MKLVSRAIDNNANIFTDLGATFSCLSGSDFGTKISKNAKLIVIIIHHSSVTIILRCLAIRSLCSRFIEDSIAEKKLQVLALVK
jgi:hypothetical protein